MPRSRVTVPDDMYRAKPNAGLVEFLSNLRQVFVEIMLGELKFELALNGFIGGAHNQALGTFRLLISRH